jgi:CYTH domain-containing protein
MLPHHKFARIERERRFLVLQLPPEQQITRVRRIRDRYIDGTNLRLREETEGSQPTLFKLTQKIRQPGAGFQQGWITTMYLDQTTHERLSNLPAQVLTKIRYSVPPFGIDVFEGVLEGLVLAEAEFDSEADAADLTIPTFISREVSTDARFTGGFLARASRHDLQAWLAEYGVGI